MLIQNCSLGTGMGSGWGGEACQDALPVAVGGFGGRGRRFRHAAVLEADPAAGVAAGMHLGQLGDLLDQLIQPFVYRASWVLVGIYEQVSERIDVFLRVLHHAPYTFVPVP